MKILSYSKALYSSWLYYSPDRILFDAGESVSSIMGNKCFAVDRVFLSHGHTDHIAGLVSLVNIRNNAMGDKQKPLKVYYPRNNFHVSEMMNYLSRTNTNLTYSLEWIPLEIEDKIQVHGDENERNSRFVKAFPTEHSKQEASLGYNVVENRQRLRDKFHHLEQEEIKELAREKPREELMESYQQRIFSYGGDSVPLDPKHVKGTEILCHDCTFLSASDREMFKHATLREAIQVAKKARVSQKLLGIHVSSRYKHTYREKVQKVLSEESTLFEFELIPPGKIFRIG